VRLLAFAGARDVLGVAELTLPLESPCTAEELLAEVCRRYPALVPWRRAIRIAVNGAYAAADDRVTFGDEVALIPPVAGGAAAKVAVSAAPLSLPDVVAVVEGPSRGGVVTFAGVVRREGHQISDVIRLEYEAYGPMALEVLAAIAGEIEAEWPGTRVAIHHRTGALVVGETAVVIAAAAPHRAEAFAACRAAIDRLKERAPIWKKEIGESGAVWLGLGP
jgi:molybdopterin synthase catalytic subunit/molybdopterin converting factor small subunit